MKKYQIVGLPKKYKGGALPQAQSGVQVPRDKRKAFNKFLDEWAEYGSYYEWNPDGTPVTMDQRVEKFYKSLQAANQQPTSAKIVQTKSPDKETWADRRRFKKFIKATMDDVYKDYVFRDTPEGKYNLATSGYKKVLNPNYIFDDPDTPNVNEEQEAILSGKQAPDMRYLIDLPTSDIAGGKNKKGLFKKWKARREQAEMMNHVIAGLRGYGELPMGYNNEDWKKYINKYESLIKEYKDEQHEDLQYKQYLQAKKDWEKKRGRYSGSMGQRYWLSDYKENNWARFDPATTKEEFPGYWKLMSDLGTEEKRKNLQAQLRMIPEFLGASVVRAYKEPGKTVEEFKKGFGDLYDVATTDKTLDDIELGQGFYDGIYMGTLPIGTGVYSKAWNTGKFIHGLGKGTSSVQLLNRSNLPFAFRYKNIYGTDIGIGASKYNLTNYKPLVQGTTGSGQWTIATKPLQQQMKSTSTVVNAPGPLLSNTKSLSLPNITSSSVIPSAKIIEPTPSVPAQKTEKINYYATNNPDGSIVFDHLGNFHTGLVAPDDAGQFMNTWKTDGYIFDEAAKTMKPKSKTSFKTLDENGKIADLKNSEGNVSTEKALRIMEKDESASSLKVSRIKKELENRYDGTIPAEISFDELNDVANSTIIPLNIKVIKQGNPTYGYNNVGYDDFIFNNDIDPSNISKTKEAYKQTFEDAKNLPQKQIEIGDKLFQARVINKDLTAERNAISAEILTYQESGFEKWWKKVYDEGDNITLMEARKRYRLELDKDPTYQKLLAERQEASQAVGKQDLVVFELEKEQRLIDEQLSKLRASKNTSFSSKRMRDQNVNNFTIYPRQLVFSNKSEFPGFGVNAHNAGADALGRVYASVRSNTPDTLTATQIQSEFSQKQYGKNQTSMPLLKNQLAVNEFSEIIAQANRDVVKNLGIADMVYTPTGEELLTDAGYVRRKDSTGRTYYVKGRKGDEDYNFFWGPNQGSMMYGIKVQRLQDAYRAKHPIDWDFVDAQKAKQEQIQADINYINSAFKDGLSDAQKALYQDVDLQTVINRVEDVLGRSLFDLGPTTENYDIAKGAIKKQMDVVPDGKMLQRYNYERMVQETVDYAARNNFKKVRFPTGATANKIQSYDVHHQSRANYNLKNISEIPKDGNPVNLGAAIHNNIDINKAEAVISKNLTQDQRIKLISALNEEIRHKGMGDALASNRLTVDEIVDIATSDEPLWQYVKEKVSTGEGTKTIRTFKSKYFTEEDVDKIKILNSEGKRLTNYFKKYKDSPTGRGGDDQWKLLEDGRFRILDRYENLDKLLKKYYPDAKIEKVSDEYGNTWWELIFPESVLKGTKPIVPYKQGGSVEADLSPEDVERYVKGGYILEELQDGGEGDKDVQNLPETKITRSKWGSGKGEEKFTKADKQAARDAQWTDVALSILEKNPNMTQEEFFEKYNRLPKRKYKNLTLDQLTHFFKNRKAYRTKARDKRLGLERKLNLWDKYHTPDGKVDYSKIGKDDWLRLYESQGLAEVDPNTSRGGIDYDQTELEKIWYANPLSALWRGLRKGERPRYTKEDLPEEMGGKARNWVDDVKKMAVATAYAPGAYYTLPGVLANKAVQAGLTGYGFYDGVTNTGPATIQALKDGRGWDATKQGAYTALNFLPAAVIGPRLLKGARREFMYNAINPSEYGIKNKIKAMPGELYRNITNPAGRPARVFSKSGFYTDEAENIAAGKRRLDAWGTYLGKRQKYNTFTKHSDGTYSLNDEFVNTPKLGNTNFQPRVQNEIAADVHLYEIDKLLKAGKIDEATALKLRAKVYDLRNYNPDSNLPGHNEMMSILKGKNKKLYNNIKFDKQQRIVKPSNDPNYDYVVFDVDKYGVRGGFSYNVKVPKNNIVETTLSGRPKSLPNKGSISTQRSNINKTNTTGSGNEYIIESNDRWDLMPFQQEAGKTHMFQAGTNKKKGLLENFEIGRLIGGKPFDIRKKQTFDLNLDKVPNKFLNAPIDFSSFIKGRFDKGGSFFEANLSKEDVKKYIEGGYILEELD